MKTAYALLNIEYGGREAVISKLKDIPNVKKISSTQGQYDMMLMLNGSTVKEIQGVIASKIKNIKEIRSVLCLIIADKPTVQAALSRELTKY